MNENHVPFLIKDIGTRINEVSAIIGGKKEVAKVAGLSESQLHRIVAGDSQPKLEPIVAIARAANISLEWLATGEGPMRPDEVREGRANYSVEMGEFALIPGYNVEVAAGVGTFPGGEESTRKLAFRHKWLRYRNLKPENLVLVFAKGDSMEPTINDNNTLMIDTSNRELIDGHIYVIRTDGHLIVKRIQKLWNKGILLLSDNKEYREQQIEPNEADDLEVIGKVVWIGKDV
jgi:phage repressor protein C with HTH and peptisase S24 domain